MITRHLGGVPGPRTPWDVLDYFADRPELDADATRGLVCLLDEVEKQVLNFEEFEIISKEFAQYLRENGKEAVGNV